MRARRIRPPFLNQTPIQLERVEQLVIDAVCDVLLCAHTRMLCDSRTAQASKAEARRGEINARQAQ